MECDALRPRRGDRSIVKEIDQDEIPEVTKLFPVAALVGCHVIEAWRVDNPYLKCMQERCSSESRREWVFHGAPEDRLDGISREGLRADLNQNPMANNAIFFSPGLRYAGHYKHGACNTTEELLAQWYHDTVIGADVPPAARTPYQKPIFTPLYGTHSCNDVYWAFACEAFSDDIINVNEHVSKVSEQCMVIPKYLLYFVHTETLKFTRRSWQL